MKNSIFLITFLIASNASFAEVISKSFELRYVSDDAKADGATGFKGASSLFDNDDRLEYLNRYATYAKGYFNDPRMDKKVVTLDQARERLKAIKPQPLPSVRKRLLGQWKAYGYKDGQHEDARRRIAFFNSKRGGSVEDGVFTIEPKKKVVLEFKRQDWRLNLAWQVWVEPDTRFVLTLGEAVTIDFDNTDSLSGWTDFKVELDMVNQRSNLYINHKLIGDFRPFENKTLELSSFEIRAGSKVQIDNIHGVGYTKDYTDGTDDLHSRDVPFLIDTFIDEDFEPAPDIEGWAKAGYDDSKWNTVDLPYAHGGERYRDEALYLRKSFVIPKSKRVAINVECLDPSGELWVNGQPVYIARDRHPISLDITRYVDFDRENLITIKVDPYEVEETMRHTSADEYIGWFAGRVHLDCTSDVYVRDAFATTESIGEQAEIKAEIWIKKDEAKNSTERETKSLQSFGGHVQLKLYKWYPQESSEPVAQAKQKLNIRNGKDEKVVFSMKVEDADLWSPEAPHLYKLHAEVFDESNQLVDDYVITTGIRTVSQEGGTFRINGKPAMMNGALLFSMPAPLDKLAQWQRSAPGENILKDLMQLKAMNANTARMSQHHGPVISINDPRYAEYGDQLGIMFQWATTSWVRTQSPWALDFEGLPKYIRQVRNHPSIVMWQPGNHPRFLDFEEAMEWFQKVYDLIWMEDQSRLVAPTANLARLVDLRSDDGTSRVEGKAASDTWVLPGLTRGSMEEMLGYGADWGKIEKWPNVKKTESEQNWGIGTFRVDYLNSEHRAFFDFESEETAGQPNWNLRKGKPGYEIMSYEWGYDEGSIGMFLRPDQWLTSQAWQAFSGFEGYKKKRWLDYDGLAWCSLRGGGNTATYRKPLIDYYDHAKLAFYAVKMSFQSVLACSKNVDLVYGPSDRVPVVVMNMGDEKTVDVDVEVKSLSGAVLFRQTFTDVLLSEGRTFKNLELAIEGELEPGVYAFEYQVSR